MTYKETILKINSLNVSGIKPGLERIQKLLNLLGDPHKKLKFIHVAGTNGKGSVCFMLSKILEKSGYKTGLYISPSINDFKERMQINGELISKEDFCRIFDYIENFFDNFKDDMLTEFEVITAMAFKYFEEKNCDVVVLETGMGGKFDATNVIENSLCSVITTVSYDHTEFLGSNILEIAKEKLGIIKPNSRVVIGESQDKEIYDLAKEISKNSRCDIFIADSSKIKDFKNVNFKKSSFSYENKKLEVNLLGNHQKRNIAVVLKVLEAISKDFKTDFTSLKNGLKEVYIPCRLEILNYSPLVILDASHNTESINALANFIRENLSSKRIFAVCGMFADKDIDGSFKIIGKYLNKIFIIKPDSPRGIDLKQMEQIVKKHNKNVIACENFSKEVGNIVSSIPKKDALVVFGSFSIMKDAKNFLNSAFKY